MPKIPEDDHLAKELAQDIKDSKGELPSKISAASLGLANMPLPDVHAMPKQFLNSASERTTKTKNTGIFILVGGVVFIIAIFICYLR